MVRLSGPHPIRNIVISNTGAQIIGKIAGSGTAFLSSVILARELGASGYGDFSKVVTYVSLFYLAADFGMNAIYLQKVAGTQDTRTWQELLGVRLTLAVGLTLLAVAGLLVLPIGIDQGYTAGVRMGILVFAPSILLQAIITTGNGFFQKNLWYMGSTWALIFGSATPLLLLLAITGTTNTLSPIPAIIVFLLGTAVTASLSLRLIQNHKQPVRPVFRHKAFTNLLVPSIPLGLTLISNLVFFRIDTIILTLTRPTIEVGIYNFAYKIFELPLVIPTFSMNALYPLLVKALNENNDSYLALTKNAFVPLLVISLVVGAGLWIFAPLVSLIQAEFVAAIPILRIFSLGMPFFFLSSITMWMLVSTRKYWHLFSIYGLSMIGVILSNAYFIPQYGALAAAWLTIFWEFVVFCASAIILTRRTPASRQ